MPRVRADDYDDKARTIMESAATLFAKVGYPSAKMQDIAKSCGASKSMLYHYFPTKDDLLVAMLKEHLAKVIFDIEEAVANNDTANERLAALVDVFIPKSNKSHRHHVIAMHDLKFLPKALQTPLLRMEVKVAELVTSILKDVNPGLPAEVYKPYAMLMLGMLNWTDTWYRPSGAIKPQELCDRVARLFLHGYCAEKR